MKKIKLIFAGASIGVLFLFTSPLPAHAGSAADQIREGVDTAAGKDDTAKTRDIGNVVRTLINLISVIVGAIAVIMLIFGGFRYVTSGGNDTAVASAKNTILYAIAGLVVVALAQIIVQFVLTGISETQNSSSSTTNGPGSSNDRLPSQKTLIPD